ncbi:PAS domain-containing protein [Dactylosporangium salmoneum]|uniref:PAS domain-containing protein n=1 Tax=Dactylosporangium salmoneum TaxID=53361 RepID=A0ABN3GWF0_9ACTN
MRKDHAAVIIGADPAVQRVLGWSAQELTGRRAIDLVHPDDRQRAIAAWMDLLATPHGEARRIRLRHLHRDGRTPSRPPRWTWAACRCIRRRASAWPGPARAASAPTR